MLASSVIVSATTDDLDSVCQVDERQIYFVN